MALQLAPPSPNQLAYVADQASNNVTVVDVDNREPLGTIDVGEMPNGIAITPDEQFVYVVNRVGNSVPVISTATNTVLWTLNVGAAPIAVAIMPTGSHGYVSNFRSATISVIANVQEPTGSFVEGTTLVGPNADPALMSINPAGDSLYVLNPNHGFITVIRPKTTNVSVRLR